MAALPTVSAIVPTHQRLPMLRRVVDALLAQEELHQLVVAVDGSTDGTQEWLERRRAEDDRLTVLALAKGGVAAARQAGLEAATGEVVLFLDDDVIAGPGLVVEHAAHHRKAARLVVQGYMPNRWRDLPERRRAIGRVYRLAYETTCARYAREPDHILLGFWAGNFSMRREDCLRVGLIAPVLAPEAREEDREFGIRSYRAGLTGRFDRSLLAEHLFERDLPEFLRDCRQSGFFRPIIHRLHPDVVGPDLIQHGDTANTLDRPGKALPGPIRRIWPTLATEPFYRVLSRALIWSFEGTLRLRSLAAQTLVVRGLASLETQRGVLDGGDHPAPPASSVSA